MNSTKSCIFQRIFTVFLCIVFVLYWAAILYINFSCNPALYNTDMYTDMNYAGQVWESRSIFPGGWVFGNQVYVVATPVVAALFYGITGNHCISMGAASTVMGALVIISFAWMLKPIFTGFRDRLLAILLFMTLCLASGDVYSAHNGWQLLFTMCSYYACYAITCMLAFGCYLRVISSEETFPRIPLIITVLLSFATGIQSLRQTAVMIVPLVGMEILRLSYFALKKQKPDLRPVWVTVCLTVSNLAGLLTFRLMDLPMNQIYGSLSINSFSEFGSNLLFAILHIYDLLLNMSRLEKLLLLLVLIYAVYSILHSLRSSGPDSRVVCFLLLLFSFCGICFIDVFLSMEVRNIYYFMLFPFLAFTLVCGFQLGKHCAKAITPVLLLLLFANSLFTSLIPCYQLDHRAARQQYQSVSDYLLEEGYTTVFSGWNIGDEILIASDWELQAGFWDDAGSAFQKIGYLCDPEVFDQDASRCAYLFYGEADMQTAMDIASSAGQKLTLLRYFPETNYYVCTSDINLMNELP